MATTFAVLTRANRAIPPSFRNGGIAVLLLMLAVGFVPLFGGPGYEHALASGLVVPTAAAIATALDVARDRDAPLTWLTGLFRGVASGIVFAVISVLTSLLHAARVGVCEISGALLYFALTAGAGSAMGGAWGSVAGGIVRLLRPRLRRVRVVAVLLALAGPLLCVVISVGRFYTSPMIFAFDPFVGYFSGVLYDTVIDGGMSLLTYRLGSLCTLVALALIASSIRRDGGTIALTSPRDPAKVRIALGVLAAVASLSITIAGTHLGHFSTASSIARELGSEKHGTRCDVVYPATTREQEANLLVKDCDEELAAVEKAIGVRGPDRIRAYFFRDAEEKKRLMGAAHTYVAKPWREEVYLQLANYPHPVLAHEIAHVVAGRVGRGPFRVAGELGGLVPNPGLIEGIAVAAAPDDEDLTDAQWGRAMMQIGILPPMQRVFSLRFLGETSAKSYTLAGAFVTWIGDKHGMDTVRRWYGGADLPSLVGKDWKTLDADFRAFLATVPLPEEAESFARAKFARPGIFGRKCPHLVDALRHEADTCRDAARYADALRLYEEAVAKDALDFASRHAKAQVMRRHGDRERGLSELSALATGKEVPRSYRDRAEEALADAELIDGDFESARKRYETLAARSLDEDSARTLEVKGLAAKDPDARAAVTALLVGDAKRGPDAYVGGVALGEWTTKTPSGLAAYLIGRQLASRGFYEAAAAALDRAIGLGLPSPRVSRETLRQRAVTACATGDRRALEAVRNAIESPTDPFVGASGGRREATLRMIARCLALAQD